MTLPETLVKTDLGLIFIIFYLQPSIFIVTYAVLLSCMGNSGA